MEVQILSRKVIKPSVPTSHHLLKISFFDQIAPPAYVPFVLYYQPDDKLILSEKEEIHNRLETSLSETLTRYYPLAGRYIRDELSVDCNDEGALYVEAKVDGRLAQLLQKKPAEGKVLNRLLPFEDEMSFNTILLGIQINRFDCGGLAIGVCVSHKVADGATASSFINAWATACRAGINAVVSPSFAAGSLFPATGTLNFVAAPVSIGDSIKIVTKRFLFDREAISSLKAKATAHVCDADSKPPPPPSRVQVVTALIWKALIGVSQLKHSQPRPSLLVSSFNFREKMALGVPQNAFGNLYHMVVTRFKPKDNNLKLQDLVSLVSRSVSKAREDIAKIDKSDDMLAMVSNSSREVGEQVRGGDTDVSIITSLCRFPFYEADFGWGQPVWFSSVHKPLELGFLVDTKCGTGIEAWMSLEETNMLHFEQDQDITAFTSN